MSMKRQIAADGSIADPCFETAWQVSEHLLEVTRVALFENDVVAYCRRFDLPSEVATDIGVQILDSSRQVAELLAAVRRHVTAVKALDLRRHVTSARFVAPDVVHSTHESSWVLPGGVRSDGLAAESIAVFRDGLWRLRASHYATTGFPLLDRALSGGWR